MAALLALPPELVGLIVSVLAEGEPPSAKLLHVEPSDSLLRSGYHPLKDLSQACRATREWCFPSLFAAVKVDLDSIDGFLKFSESQGLSKHTDSLVLYIDPNSQVEKSSNIPGHYVWLPMVRVVDSIKPSLMTVVLPPSLFAKILPHQPNLVDREAFNNPYQVLQLRMPRDLASSLRTSQDTIGWRNVFQMRPWTHCTFNQGGSTKGSSSYEYFYNQMPSVFNARSFNKVIRRTMEDSFESLTSIDYIAVFPLDDILIQFCQCMNLMKNLKCLRTQLADTPSNIAGLGKRRQRYLWQEFEGCYDTLARHVCANWDKGLTSLEEFVSLDYVNLSCRELIDRTAGRILVKWESDPKRGRWIRKEESPIRFQPVNERLGVIWEQ